MDKVCKGTDFKILQVTFLVIDGLILTTYIPILYYFAKPMKQFTEKKMLLFGVYFFIFFNIAFLLSEFFRMMMACGSGDDSLLNAIMSGTYFLQTYGILLVAYYRLYFVFNKSIFSLSRCTMNMYKALLILVPLLATTGIVLKKCCKGDFLVQLSLFMLVTSLLSIMILFLSKLKRVYQSDSESSMRSEHSNNLMSIMTKVTILNVVSIMITFVAIITLVFVVILNPNYVAGDHYVSTLSVIAFSTTADAYSNLICIMLSFTIFDAYYDKICACLDIKCKAICNKITGQNERNLALENAQKTHSNSSNSNDIPKNMPEV